MEKEIDNKLNSKNRVSPIRIHQLKKMVYNKGNKIEYLEIVKNSLKENNKFVKAPLRKFINRYVKTLNQKQLNQLYHKLVKLSDFIDSNPIQDSYIEGVLTGVSNKVFNTLLYPQDYPLSEVLFNYLYNFTLLPSYKNQQQFNADMLGVIERMENNVKKYLQYPIYMKSIDSSLVIDILDKKQIFSDPLEFVVSQPVNNHPFIFKIVLGVYFNGYDNNIRYKKDVIQSRLLVKYSEHGLNIPIVLKYMLHKYGYKMYDDNYYILSTYDTHNTYITFWISYDEEITDPGNFHTQIILESYPIHENDIDNYSYITNSLADQENQISKISKILSYDLIKREIFNLLTELKKKPDLMQVMPNFFTGEEKEEILKIINLPENPKNKIEKLYKVIQDFFKDQKDNFIPEVIDFNDKLKILSDDLGIELGDEYYGYDGEMTNEETMNKYLTKVKPVDLAPKLFLENETKNQIEFIIKFLKNKDSFKKYLLKLPKGAIFYGPAGTGKTETVKHIAKETGLQVYKVDISDILNKYVGESEKQIKEMFQEYYKNLEKENAILFIDEGDGFFGKRDSENRDLQNGVRSIILQELEGFFSNPNLEKGFIIVATNFMENIDKAIKERLGLFVKFDLPTKEKRKEYLEFMLDFYKNNKGVEVKDVDLDILGNQTKNFSYRMLSKLISVAIIQAVTNMINEGEKVPILTDNLLAQAIKTVTEEKIIERKIGF